MGGMGLTRSKRAAHQDASEEASAALQELTSGAQQTGALQVLEGVMAQVQALAAQDDLQSAFRQLEAADLFLEQQQEEVAGVPEEQRTQLTLLLSAGFVTVARRLHAASLLDTLPNWRHVLRRAVATLDSLSPDTSNTQALDILETMVEDGDFDVPAEEDLQGPGIAPQFDLDGQIGLYLQSLGRSALAQGTKDDRQNKQAGAPRVVIPEGGGGGDAMDLADQVQRFEERRGEGGQLVALDDVAMRPVLLRVCPHLPTDHPLRMEVEAALGAQAGTPEWQALVQDAMSAAAAAGVVLPPVGSGSAAGEAEPTPSALLDGLGSLGGRSMPNLLLSLDVGEPGAGGDLPLDTTGSLAIFSPVPRLTSCDSRLAFFGSKAAGGLLGDDAAEESSQGLEDAEVAGMMPPAAAAGGKSQGGAGGSMVGVGASYGSFASTMVSLPSELNLGMPSGPSMSSASAMASLANMLAGDDPSGSAADGLDGLGLPSRVEFSSISNAADGAADAMLVGMAGGSVPPGMDAMLQAQQGPTCNSPGVAMWGAALPADLEAAVGAGGAGPRSASPLAVVTAGFGDDGVAEVGSAGFDDVWLAGGLDDGPAALLGDVSMGVTTGKRPLSALPLPRRDAKRVR